MHEYHKAFCLEEGECGETSLVELEIDTGSAVLKQQRVRRMPYAVQTKVAKQLQSMQDVSVVQPSSSPWALWSWCARRTVHTDFVLQRLELSHQVRLIPSPMH